MKSNKKRRNPRTNQPVVRLVAVSSEPEPASAAPVSPQLKGAGAIHSSANSKRFWFMALTMLLGVLLGRAVILEMLSPFALAGYAVSLQMRKGTAIWMSAGLLIGSVTAISSGANPLLLLATLISYRFLLYLLKRLDHVDVHAIPFLVLAVDLGFRLGFALPTTGITWYVAGMSAIDGFLTFMLTLMFLQMPPLFMGSRQQKPLGSEEIIALIILLASLLTGLQGVTIHGISLESVLARYLVVLAAVVGGAGIGGAVGVVTGVILALGSLSMGSLIGVFGFAGVLAGILREAKRLLAGLGFLFGTTVLALYISPPQVVMNGFVETSLALVLLYLTPERWMFFLSRFVPGTHQYALSQQDHARRIKELMTARIEEVASVFSQLACSFHDISEQVRKVDDAALNQTIDLTVQELCRNCRKHDRCWSDDFYGTYLAMKETIEQIQATPAMTVQDIQRNMYSRCAKVHELLPTLKRSSSLIARDMAIVRQLRESRGLVACQLSGVADIMTDLAQEIKRENGVNHKQEAQILETLGRLGLEVQGIDIISLEEGRVEIEVLQMKPTGHDECGKLVAPLLSEVLGETITVAKTERSRDGSCQVVTLTSSRLYDVKYGFASAAKEGALQSGDSFSAIDVGNGRFAIALSDGMGNGERASKESSAAVKLVQQLLRAGFDEGVAIKTVNSALVLRSPEEIYATLDLAIIDLYTLTTEFLKVGSVATFVKQGRSVFVVRGESVPIGILNEIEVQTRRIKLTEHDMVVFLSDGILDAVAHMQDAEDWVKRQLERFDANDPQIVADLLLEATVRAAGGAIPDDMTVVCARLERFKPQWATIRLPNLPSLRGPRQKGNMTKREKTQRLVHV